MALAHSAHVWIKQHIQRPFMTPLGTVKRRGKLGSTVLANRIELRQSLFLCATCERKMPTGWMRRYEYRLIPNMHSEHTRCDACQQLDSANVFTAEDQGYFQEYQHLQGIATRAAAVQVAVRDHRRVR